MAQVITIYTRSSRNAHRLEDVRNSRLLCELCPCYSDRYENSSSGTTLMPTNRSKAHERSFQTEVISQCWSEILTCEILVAPSRGRWAERRPTTKQLCLSNAITLDTKFLAQLGIEQRTSTSDCSGLVLRSSDGDSGGAKHFAFLPFRQTYIDVQDKVLLSFFLYQLVQVFEHNENLEQDISWWGFFVSCFGHFARKCAPLFMSGDVTALRYNSAVTYFLPLFFY